MKLYVCHILTAICILGFSSCSKKDSSLLKGNGKKKINVENKEQEKQEEQKDIKYLFLDPCESLETLQGQTKTTIELLFEYANIELKIENCQKVFSKYASLRSLDISADALLDIRPIMAFSNLTKLVLNNNIIEFIPDEISNLEDLTELNLGSNNIYEIPNSLYTLNKLKVLDLNGNKIEDISKRVSNLKELEKLDLEGNLIENVPASLADLPKIKLIKLDGNKELKTLPSSFKKLKAEKKISFDEGVVIEE